jgi:hypothetical protein
MGHQQVNHRYAVVAPSSTSRRIVLCAVATVLAFVACAFLLGRGADAVPALASAAIAVVVSLLFATMCLLHWRRSVELDAGLLVIRAGLNTRRVQASALELERARIIDLDQQVELLPGRKTLGTSLPGYQSGWFRTRQWGKGFYLLTERRRVLWLPERNGAHLLLSLQQPQALLAALNAMVPRRHEG